MVNWFTRLDMSQLWRRKNKETSNLHILALLTSVLPFKYSPSETFHIVPLMLPPKERALIFTSSHHSNVSKLAASSLGKLSSADSQTAQQRHIVAETRVLLFLTEHLSNSLLAAVTWKPTAPFFPLEGPPTPTALSEVISFLPYPQCQWK